jgi:antitoxin (DNA-binding transcriptional repressor) of toxin-antitoxin stability system
MYMTTVGIAELRQNLSEYLRRVEHGERLVVTAACRSHSSSKATLAP